MAPAEPTLNTRIVVLDVPLPDRTLCLGLVADRVFEAATFAEEQIEAAQDIEVGGGCGRHVGFSRAQGLPRSVERRWSCETLAAQRRRRPPAPPGLDGGASP